MSYGEAITLSVVDTLQVEAEKLAMEQGVMTHPVHLLAVLLKSKSSTSVARVMEEAGLFPSKVDEALQELKPQLPRNIASQRTSLYNGVLAVAEALAQQHDQERTKAVQVYDLTEAIMMAGDKVVDRFIEAVRASDSVATRPSILGTLKAIKRLELPRTSPTPIITQHD